MVHIRRIARACTASRLSAARLAARYRTQHGRTQRVTASAPIAIPSRRCGDATRRRMGKVAKPHFGRRARDKGRKSKSKRHGGWMAGQQAKVAKAATAAGAETAPPPPRPRKVSGPSGRKRVLEPQVLSDHPANVAQRKRRRKTPPTRGAPSSCSMVSKPPRSSRRPRGRPRRRERRRRIGPLPLPSLGAAMMERVRQWSGRCASAQAGATVGHSCGAG